jgi:bleomycin hydrolase
MARVTTPEFSIRLILRFEIKNDKITGVIDSPDQGLKDIAFEKVWISGDSVFTNLSTSTVFKGLIMPGDSVINGVWGGNLPVRFGRTNYIFTLKTNLNPELPGYKIVKLIESTPLKDQQATGTCWSYATTSFIETEAIRLGKSPVVLSPMFYVIPTYIDKAEKYIRMNGKSGFSEGDLTFSVLKAYRDFGAIPEKIYPGKNDSLSKHDHNEMNSLLLEKVQNYVKTGRGKMTNEGYRKEIQDILITTMGKAPETFVYENKMYTPKSFAQQMIGINPDDYVEITSYSHHPFYSRFVLEIESNWNNNYYLNLPIKDFTDVIDYSLLHNYSVCWDGDIYEGYNDGFAVLNDTINNISQETRQNAFDNYTTTDVHNMHIIGIAENDKGKKFYIIKNSSDIKNCGGYLYMSKEYLQLKTISIMVHKAAIPEEIKNKLI